MCDAGGRFSKGDKREYIMLNYIICILSIGRVDRSRSMQVGIIQLVNALVWIFKSSGDSTSAFSKCINSLLALSLKLKYSDIQPTHTNTRIYEE